MGKKSDLQGIQGDSVQKNLSYQFLYQALALILPLLIAPYLTRTLGDTALGIYSYSYSIGQAFMVFANLGILKYGQRLIAEKKENPVELRTAFWSLFAVHAVASLLVGLLYFVFAVGYGGANAYVYVFQGFYVLSALFDITWLFYGLEKFRIVVFCNAFVKLSEFLLILFFVKSPEDLGIYTLIMALSVFTGMAVLLPTAIRYVKPIAFTRYDCRKHIKPLAVLFIASVATLLFTFFDKTLLGLFSTKENVAYYEYSNKIVLAPRTIATVISTVMYSRACVFLRKNDHLTAKKYRVYSLMFIYTIGFGSIFGLLAVGDTFVKAYYGEAFAVCTGIVNALSPTVLIVPLADVVRTQILIPLHKDKEYTVITLVSAGINIACSLALLKPLGVYGVVIGSLLSEFFSLVAISALCKNYISPRSDLRLAIPFLISGVLMFAAIRVLHPHLNGGLWSLLIEVAVGAAVYLALIGVYLLAFDENKKDLSAKMQRMLKRRRI